MVKICFRCLANCNEITEIAKTCNMHLLPVGFVMLNQMTRVGSVPRTGQIEMTFISKQIRTKLSPGS